MRVSTHPIVRPSSFPPGAGPVWALRIVLSALSLIAFVAVGCVGLRGDHGKLEVTYVDVGQADAIFANCPDGAHHLLIDSGDTRYPGSSAHFQGFLTSAFKGKPRRLDVVVASHGHSDHLGSMFWVLTNFTVGTYIDNGDTSPESTLFGNLQKLRQRQTREGKLRYISGKESSFCDVDFCPRVRMRILVPWAVDPGLSDQNDRSVAVRLDCDKKSFLFVGDIEGEAESVMLNRFSKEQRDLLHADVVKVGHHGSDTSSSPAFILAVSPEIAVVSVGKRDTGTNVGYKHPRLSTLRSYADWFSRTATPLTNTPGQLSAYDASTRTCRQQSCPKAMWLTVKDGTITVSTDGNILAVDKVPTAD